MEDKGSSDAIISLRDRAQFCFSAVEACHQLPDYKVASLHMWLLYVYHLGKSCGPLLHLGGEVVSGALPVDSKPLSLCMENDISFFVPRHFDV